MPQYAEEGPDDLKPESASRRERQDLADQFGQDGARSIIREALAKAGATPIAEDWSLRRDETLALLARIERAVDRDLARLESLAR